MCGYSMLNIMEMKQELIKPYDIIRSSLKFMGRKRKMCHSTFGITIAHTEEKGKPLSVKAVSSGLITRDLLFGDESNAFQDQRHM